MFYGFTHLLLFAVLFLFLNCAVYIRVLCTMVTVAVVVACIVFMVGCFTHVCHPFDIHTSISKIATYTGTLSFIYTIFEFTSIYGLYICSSVRLMSVNVMQQFNEPRKNTNTYTIHMQTCTVPVGPVCACVCVEQKKRRKNIFHKMLNSSYY